MKKRILVTIICAIAALVCGFCLAACGGKIEEKLTLDAPQNVRYDGTNISWDAVENADKYSVRIDEGSDYKVTVPKYKYTNSKNEQFNVTITAISDSLILQSSETTKTFSPIPSVEAITVQENGKLTWDEIILDGSEIVEYVLNVDGKSLAPITTNEYEISDLGEGTHSIKVCPQVSGNDSYYSKWSAVKKVTVLGKVDTSKITYSNGIIKWPTVSSAKSYDVYIDGSLVAEEWTSTAYSYDASATSFEVTIQARGDNTTIFPGEQSEAKSFLYLETINTITVENGVVCWDPVPNADGYQVRVNGTVQPNVLKNNSYAVTAGVSVELAFMPVSSNATYFSQWSAKKTVHVLKAPVIKWNREYELDGEANSNTYWDAVNGADGYEVRLTTPDGRTETTTYGETQKSFQEAFLKVGTYKVEVQAIGDADTNNTYSSQFSEPIMVTRLASPEQPLSNFIISDSKYVTQEFTVNFKMVANASGYRLYCDGNKVTDATTNQFRVTAPVDSSISEEQTFNYKVQALGNTNSTGNTITLNSLTTEALAFDITVLAAPSNPDIDGFNYSFGEVYGSSGYVLNVQGYPYESNVSTYDLRAAIKAAGIYNVKVCAKGNGADVLPSNFSKPIEVNRLSAPTNIKIDTSEASEGVLSWDKVDNASSYSIVFDNNGIPVPADTIKNINEKITQQGTTVYMVSNANTFNDKKTVYYMESVESATVNFIKLAAPTFGDVAFSNDQFIWKASANINTKVYTPTYQVYGADFTKYNGEKVGTTMDISYLESGKQYTFYVKAFGNGTSNGKDPGFINSGYSAPMTIYKLATPDVKRSENGTYVWNGVPRTTEYVVYVDGKVMERFAHDSDRASYEYTPKFDDIKNGQSYYSVEVIAVGDNGNSTINSAPCKIQQQTKQLDTPTFTFAYSHECFDENGTIDVTISKQSTYAKGYGYIIAGVTTKFDATTYSHNTNSVGSFDISVYALGGNFDENGMYYLDSQKANAQTITLLARPNSTEITLSRDGVVEWPTIAKAVGYTIVITADGEAISEQPITVGSGTTNYLIPNYVSAYRGKLIAVTITANGNGNTIISSKPAEQSWQTNN